MATTSDAVAPVLVLALLLGGCSDGPPPEETQGRSGSGPATALDGCPPDPNRRGAPTDDGFDDPYQDLPGAVPEGATAARICPGGGITPQVPADILTTSVDVLVDAVNALPEEERGACHADLGPGYRILFDYEDGSTFLISAHYAGCQDVVVGSGTREHPRIPARTFIDLLRAQRESQTPPDLPSNPQDLRCDPGFIDPFAALGRAIDITAATLCVDADTGTTAHRRARIPAERLPILVDDLASTEPRTGRHPCLDRPRQRAWIVATTSWGDRMVIHADCADFRLPTGELWVPSPRAQRIIDRLVSATRPVR